MKTFLSIICFLTLFASKGQINQKYGLGQLCAVGRGIAVSNTIIHVAGVVCSPHDSSTVVIRSYYSIYDMSGNQVYFDFVGDTLQQYEIESVLIDEDSNRYLIGDYLYDSTGNRINKGVFIQKRDPLKNIVWTKEYKEQDSLKSYFIRSASLLSNGNIAIVGNLNFTDVDSIVVPGVPDADVLLLVYDSSGQMLVNKKFGNDSSQDDGRNIVDGGNNTILIGAQKKIPFTGEKSWVIETDYQGNFIQEYLSSSNRIIGARDLVRTQDGGVAYVGSIYQNQNFDDRYNIYVEKLDSGLNPKWAWQSNIIYSQLNWGSSIERDANENLLISGRKYGYLFDPDTVGFYGFLQKLSPSGDSIWQREYGILNNSNINETHIFNDMVHVNNTTYLVGEVLDRANPIPPYQEMWLVSVDSNGVISGENALQYKNYGLSIYPNPANEIITFSMEKIEGNHSLEIFDLSGRIFHQIETTESSYELDISLWPSGIYVYRIQNEEGIIRGKFLKE
jgi:hypothetical protein